MERESSLKIILRDKSNHPIKGFGSVKLHLDSWKSIFLHDVMYVSGLKKNLVSISALEDKGMRVSFIKGKLLLWMVGTPLRDAFTLGYRFERLYKVIVRPLLALVHDTNHQSKLWHRRLAHLHYDILPKMKKIGPYNSRCSSPTWWSMSSMCQWKEYKETIHLYQ